jgi:hypothetical protein
MELTKIHKAIYTPPMEQIDDDFIEGDDELMDIEESYKIIEKAIDDIYDEK